MPQAQTGKSSVISQYIYNLLLDNKTLLGANGIAYGDQFQVGPTPAICVESGTMTRQLAGAPYMVENNFEVYLMVYHAKIQDTQITKLECEQFVERVADLLHTDKQMDGLVISGHVTRQDPGYSNRGGALLHSTRMLWEGLSKTSLDI